MNPLLSKAVLNKSEQELIDSLDFKSNNKIDSSQMELIVKALEGTWHSQHEDLVNTIYLENIIDDRLIEPLMSIVLNKDTYRWYDDETESTLRKCVLVLNMINSEKSKEAIGKLDALDNENIKYTLETNN